MKRVGEIVGEVNAQLSEAERILSWLLLARPLSVEKGEMTHTAKLRRRVVAQRFADQIAALYTGLEPMPAIRRVSDRPP